MNKKYTLNQNNGEVLTYERIDEIANEYLKDIDIAIHDRFDGNSDIQTDKYHFEFTDDEIYLRILNYQILYVLEEVYIFWDKSNNDTMKYYGKELADVEDLLKFSISIQIREHNPYTKGLVSRGWIYYNPKLDNLEFEKKPIKVKSKYTAKCLAFIIQLANPQTKLSWQNLYAPGYINEEKTQEFEI